MQGFNQFQHQEEIAQLRQIEEKLRGGTALIVALLHCRKLYVANVGELERQELQNFKLLVCQSCEWYR